MVLRERWQKSRGISSLGCGTYGNCVNDKEGQHFKTGLHARYSNFIFWFFLSLSVLALWMLRTKQAHWDFYTSLEDFQMNRQHYKGSAEWILPCVFNQRLHNKLESRSDK